MFLYSLENQGYLNRISKWRMLSLHIILLIAFLFLNGCNQASSNHLYENHILGISLEKPANWSVEYRERNGLLVLEAESGFWHRNTTRIEILGNACSSNSWFNRPREELVANLERIRSLYNLESITIIQEPISIDNGDFDIIRVIIAVPTSAMLKDTSRIQVKDREPGALQTIDLYAITNEGITFFAYIYEGDDNELNEQARIIIDSIQLICTSESSFDKNS
jgi:hypothetical protein